MTVIPLLDLRANYQSGQVRMTWKFPQNAPETVYIYSARRSGENVEFDMRTHISKDLRDCAGGLSFEYSGFSDSDVKQVTFCVFLADRNYNTPNMRVIRSQKECFINVIIGEAYISYDVRSKPCGGGLSEHRIWVRSLCEIDEGILGYAYNFNGREITVELPGKVSGGITEYPRFYLTDTVPPVITVVGGRNSDIAVENKKISFFRRMFRAKKFK